MFHEACILCSWLIGFSKELVDTEMVVMIINISHVIEQPNKTGPIG